MCFTLLCILYIVFYSFSFFFSSLMFSFTIITIIIIIIIIIIMFLWTFAVWNKIRLIDWLIDWLIKLFLLSAPKMSLSPFRGDTLRWQTWNLASGSGPQVRYTVPNFTFIGAKNVGIQPLNCQNFEFLP